MEAITALEVRARYKRASTIVDSTPNAAASAGVAEQNEADDTEDDDAHRQDVGAH